MNRYLEEVCYCVRKYMQEEVRQYSYLEVD